jgi:16S rRNA (uracil1498-N3)-methyltransferase
MHRFYVAPQDSRGALLTLTGSEAHHAIRVLRIRDGERVSVLDGAGQELHCEVAERTSKTVSLNVIERRSLPPLPCAVTLVQAIPKGKIIESIIQKATELGAARIVPVLTERAVTHLDSESAEAKAEKWQQVAIEAVKQCGNPWLPKVEVPLSLERFLSGQERFDLALVACLESGTRHPRDWFNKFLAQYASPPKTLGLFVGPEGDFTPAEYAAIKTGGGLPITLGPLVLRVETAAMYCLSIANYELQALRRD